MPAFVILRYLLFSSVVLCVVYILNNILVNVQLTLLYCEFERNIFIFQDGTYSDIGKTAHAPCIVVAPNCARTKHVRCPNLFNYNDIVHVHVVQET